MMATVRHVTSSSGLRKFQTARFLLKRGYKIFPTVFTVPRGTRQSHCILQRTPALFTFFFNLFVKNAYYIQRERLGFAVRNQMHFGTGLDGIMSY
jgi:hypothetical protein